METISRSLLTFLLNSLWQIPLAAGVAALACWFLRKGPASHRHTVWVAALMAAVLLPLASVRRAAPTDSLQFSPSLAAQAEAAMAPPRSPDAASLSLASATSRTISLAATTATILVGVYLLFVLFRLARLAWASLRTVQVRQGAQAGEIPLRLELVRARCQEALGVESVELLFSERLSGPVTAGDAIILPEALLAEPSEDVLTTAIGHEMAHIARRDFACNFLYELLELPVSFHPAAWLIRRGIERTREMACDELVTRRLMDAGAYARSIVSMAAAMTARQRPAYTLGVFDGDILEERIRRLMERPAANLRRARLVLGAGLAALALCAVMASSLSFTARAQGAAGDMIKQGQAAYNREDYKTAAAQFQAAVRFDPSNLEAKLLLAKALLAQFVPGTDPANPLVTTARQQYQDVLARDPGNLMALKSMMVLTTNTRQFAEAREWAQKAIQADSSDADAYYTIGFLDWATAYPDYSKARVAAGMRMEDSGIIPDAGLRAGVRTDHMAQIEEGKSMLESALRINPQYSDAMAYMNLLLRIEAGIANSDAESQQLVQQADDWVGKALAAKRQQALAARAAGGTSEGRRSDAVVLPPPPPPPPPPARAGVSGGVSGGVGGTVRESVDSGTPPQRIHVAGAVQSHMLLSQAPPVYPPDAMQAGISGVVSLAVVIGKDGKVYNIQVQGGPPQLVQAAIQSVKQWVYRPTFLNGDPVEVATMVDVNFTLP